MGGPERSVILKIAVGLGQIQVVGCEVPGIRVELLVQRGEDVLRLEYIAPLGIAYHAVAPAGEFPLGDAGGEIHPHGLSGEKEHIRGGFRPFRSQITIHTVDGFQGQERDVIFISLVRANEDGQIGFLNDLRRMNVAITRARMKLVILGDAVTMSKHAFYKKLIGYIRHISQGL